MVTRPSTWILLGRTRVTATSRSLEPISRPTPEPKARSFRKSPAMGRARGMAWLGLHSLTWQSGNETGIRIQRRGAESAEISAEKTYNRVAGRRTIHGAQREERPSFARIGRLKPTPPRQVSEARVCGSAESRGHLASCSTWCHTSAGCGGGDRKHRRA